MENNKTENVVTGVNFILFSYSFFTTVAGSIGNTFIIYATTRKNHVFHMNRTNMCFIRNLAISDLLYIIARVVPVMITNLTIVWKFGYKVCLISATTASIAAIANVNLIAALTVYRLTMLSFPLRNLQLLLKHSKALCYALWLYSSILGFRSLFVVTKAVFVKQISTCILNYNYNGVENILYSTMFLITPFSIIILCNILLAIKTFIYTRNVKANSQIRITKIGMKTMLEKRRRQATITVGSLSLLLIMSWLPGFIKRFGGMKGSHPGLSQATIYLYFLNSFGNPILYTLCSHDFKTFVLKKIKSCMCKAEPTVQILRKKTGATQVKNLMPHATR